jgi:hypothetical protein
MTRLTRRRFLLRAAVGAAGLVPSVLMLGSARGLRAEAPLDERIAALFQHRQSAQRLGRAYLAAHPDEDAPRLLDRLIHLDRNRSWWKGIDDLGRALAAACSSDFGAGRVVRVEGWVLAETEARACALVAIRG